MFEEQIKSCLTIELPTQNYTDPFDIIKTKEFPYPISIKTSKKDYIELGDARRNFLRKEPYCLILLRYQQVAMLKIPVTLYIFHILPPSLDLLRGSLTVAEVDSFHNKLLQFKKGDHKAARAFAKQTRSDLSLKPSLYHLNPKIDSKQQRRLQCGVYLVDLLSLPHTPHIKYTAANNTISFFNNSLYPIQNAPRHFNKTS
jgi:hypothetical protein